MGLALHPQTAAAILLHLRGEKDAKGFVSVLGFCIKTGILPAVQDAIGKLREQP